MWFLFRKGQYPFSTKRFEGKAWEKDHLEAEDVAIWQLLHNAGVWLSFPIQIPVPSAPPRKVEVEPVNSTAIRVSWKSPLSNKQHGQIRGYQVTYVKLENNDSRGQPVIKDVMFAESQVYMHAEEPVFTLLGLESVNLFYIFFKKKLMLLLDWAFDCTCLNSKVVQELVNKYSACDVPPVAKDYQETLVEQVMNKEMMEELIARGKNLKSTANLVWTIVSPETDSLQQML